MNMNFSRSGSIHLRPLRGVFSVAAVLAVAAAFAPASSQAAAGDLCRAAGARPLDAEKVKAAVAAGEGVNTPCTFDKWTVSSPLKLVLGRGASSGSAGAAALYLVENGADPDFVNTWRTGGEYKHSRSRSNLGEAAAFGGSDLLRAFLARQPNLEFRTNNSSTPLGEALSQKNWDNARILIEAGASRYALSTGKSRSGTEVPSQTALSQAILIGAPLDFKRELLAGWDFSKDPFDLSRVYLSYELDSPTLALEFVKSLIGLGANPRTLCPFFTGWDPAVTCEADALALIVNHRRSDLDPAAGSGLIRYFASLGLSVNGKGGELLDAAVGNAEWMGLTLLELGAKADVYFPGNPNDGGGETILTGASYLGQTNLVRALVAHGAVVNDRRPRLPPLTAAVDQYSASRNCLDTIRELVRLGADVNLTDHYGRTALCLAVHSGDANPVGREDPVVALLLDHGAILGDCRR